MTKTTIDRLAMHQEAINRSSESLTATIQYLVRDANHDVEQPYYLHFDYDGPLPRTNTKNETRKVTMHNARNLDMSPMDMFQKCGFAKWNVSNPLLPDEYFDASKVTKSWHKTCKDMVKSIFPDAAKIEVLEHAVRKHDATFPSSGVERHKYAQNQPSDYVHIDYTSSSAEKSGTKKFGFKKDEYRRVVAMNIWKPIRGPVYDWPLCLCDRRSIDYSSETMAMDIVTEDYVNQNTRIYYSPRHKWYYWDGLMDDEAIVFVQSDSDAKDCAGVPHTAFECPRPDEGFQLRQSIEVRVFVYLK